LNLRSSGDAKYAGDLRRTTRPLGDLRAAHCRHRSIRRRICRLGGCALLPILPQSWSVSIYPIFPPTHIVARWLVFVTAFRQIQLSAISNKTVEGQDDFASMARSFARYSRVLLENRGAAPELAEFSQESVDESVARIRQHARRMVACPIDRRRWAGKAANSACKELQRLASKYPIIGLGRNSRGVSPR